MKNSEFFIKKSAIFEVPKFNCMKKLIVLTLLHILFLFPVYSQEKTKISEDIELIKLTANTFLSVSYGEIRGYGRVASNELIFTNNKEAILFNTPINDSLTKTLLTWLSDKMGLKVTAFVANHWHDDCIGGLNYLHVRNIKSYANKLTIDIARAQGKAVPQNGFSDSLKLRLGDKEILCYYMGAAHSTDNIVVWIPSEKLLFPGCMCKSIDSQSLGNTADGDLKEYPKTIEKVISKFGSAKIIVPGHGAPGGSELLGHTLSLVKN